MNNAEEKTKIARDVRFAVLGRALADAASAGRPELVRLVAEACIIRRQEQDSADKQVRFAGLARQVGDAARNGKDIVPVLERLMELRREELQ